MIEFPDIKELEVWLYGRKVGRLALTPDGLCAFQYDAEFSRNGYSISTLKLPLGSELFVAERMPFDGGFGVFDDSLPDGWGRMLQDRFLRENGIEPNETTVLQRLSFVGRAGRGALEYLPCHDMTPRAANKEMDGEALTSLARQAESFFFSGEASGLSLATLFAHGGSSGGARPKAFIRADGKEWLVKFRASDDPPGVGKKEYDTSLLAKRCGIEMPETRLFEGKYFGTERFDRTDCGKVHIASAAGLLHADYRAPAMDYKSLLALCRALTQNAKQVEQAYRRMVFNVVIKNRDDHAKNFSFAMDLGGDWRLAPAYDLIASHGFGGQHTTTINGKGRPEPADIFAVAEAAGISKKRAVAIYDEIREVCREAEQ